MCDQEDPRAQEPQRCMTGTCLKDTPMLWGSLRTSQVTKSLHSCGSGNSRNILALGQHWWDKIPRWGSSTRLSSAWLSPGLCAANSSQLLQSGNNGAQTPAKEHRNLVFLFPLLHWIMPSPALPRTVPCKDHYFFPSLPYAVPQQKKSFAFTGTNFSFISSFFLLI